MRRRVFAKLLLCVGAISYLVHIDMVAGAYLLGWIILLFLVGTVMHRAIGKEAVTPMSIMRAAHSVVMSRYGRQD